MNEGLLVALFLVFFISLALWLLSALERYSKQREAEREEAKRRARQAARQRREYVPKKKPEPRHNAEEQKMIEEILEQPDNILAAELLKNPKLRGEALQILHLAVTQQEVRFDLDVGEFTTPVSYPTATSSVVPMTDFSQIADIAAEELVHDDDMFALRLVTGEMMVDQYYDDRQKRLYVLHDVSPSMDWDMTFPNGKSGLKSVWSRALLAGLLSDAVLGRAEYHLRSFGGRVTERQSATSHEEAKAVLATLLKKQRSINDTAIGNAVRTAVSDIRNGALKSGMTNHILLISDGEDNKGLTAEELRELLGDDIELHVVLIGTTYDDSNPLAPHVIKMF